jgi:nucleoid DNA-binding protein
MSWKPPINYKANKELLRDERFYQLLSKELNHLSRDEVFIIYVAMVQVVERELRRNKVVRMPHLGDFALVKRASRPGVAGPHQVMLPDHEVLKFYPKQRLKRYFSERQKQARVTVSV